MFPHMGQMEFSALPTEVPSKQWRGCCNTKLQTLWVFAAPSGSCHCDSRTLVCRWRQMNWRVWFWDDARGIFQDLSQEPLSVASKLKSRPNCLRLGLRGTSFLSLRLAALSRQLWKPRGLLGIWIWRCLGGCGHHRGAAATEMRLMTMTMSLLLQSSMMTVTSTNARQNSMRHAGKICFDSQTADQKTETQNVVVSRVRSQNQLDVERKQKKKKNKSQTKLHLMRGLSSFTRHLQHAKDFTCLMHSS